MTNHLRSCLSFILITIIGITQGRAQTIRATGNVKDEENHNMAGVSVAVKGTTHGVSTSGNGNFSIDVKRTDSLVLTYTGYKSVTVLAGNNLAISMEGSIGSLNQAIVVGYGKQKQLT